MTKRKILIFGATGYLGRYMVQASLTLGHPTYAYTRPLNQSGGIGRDAKFETLQDFKARGVSIVEGELDDREKLVGILRQVDIVISALPVPQYLDQLKIINVVKEESHIERFIPSEFGNEADRSTALPPFQAILDKKKKIRRAIEAAGIPYTYVSANSLAKYFIHYFLFQGENCDKEVTIYGSGETKAVWNYEEDIAMYTIRAAIDSRTLNKTLICRPLRNIASQLDIITSWEKKAGKTLNKIHILEENVIRLIETLLLEMSIPMAILHSIFIRGDQLCFELKQDDLEASTLYADYRYTSIDELLDITLVNPPEVKIASFV
ncbi:isoeugenol synthase 1-like [Beta vulgaris subsp. vulgaris]|uniref:isoeugenol synthase 1-like n=1 Tax=Beta vulgaris subsp. vulgaris TaxID=3555 RepID=UPI002036A329|nr:isoeugenol synthase 1-like [Beta vulgaris subsp. vulgaris]